MLSRVEELAEDLTETHRAFEKAKSKIRQCKMNTVILMVKWEDSDKEDYFFFPLECVKKFESKDRFLFNIDPIAEALEKSYGRKVKSWRRFVPVIEIE